MFIGLVQEARRIIMGDLGTGKWPSAYTYSSCTMPFLDIGQGSQKEYYSTYAKRETLFLTSMRGNLERQR